MKTCSVCKVEKDEIEFSRDASRKTGRSPRCKVCERARHAKWKADNPEKVREYKAKWQADNPEKVREYTAKWSVAHPEKVRECQTRWKANNPEKVRAYEIKRRADNPEAKRIRQARWREGLSDRCVAEYLGLPNPPPELIELKREQLKMLRASRQLRQAIKEKQNE